MSTTVRALVSVALIGGYMFARDMFATAGGVISGQIAAEQLSDSNIAPLKTQFAASHFNGGSSLMFVVLLILLVAIWAGPVRRGLGLIAVALLGIGALGQPAEAYYSKYDYGEYIEILPNQSAFIIPETGDTKGGQAQFGSEKFLSESKVAAKRVQIPHTKLPNTGALSDYYVPAARLILVDRTPVSREWTASAKKGTSNTDQGFRFETADSIGLSTSIVISAFVKEEDAAKFLYWFGSKPPAQDTDENRFASVLYGRSLSDIVDGNVHRTVQAVLAQEFGRRSTDDALHQKADIMSAVEKAVREQFAPMGITVTTLGFADELSFENPEIQKAIDETFMANKRAQSAQSQLATLPVQRQILEMEIMRSDAQARQKLAERWNGSASGILPSWVVLPGDLMNWFKGLFGGGDKSAAITPPAK